MEAFSLVVVFVFGLMVGSFLNVLSLRFGFSEATRHRSGCQACGETLAWYELLPVISYLALRGRCRSCGSALSKQYPAVELLVAILFTITVWFAPLANAIDVAVLVALLAWLCVFVVLVVYDLRHTLVPIPFALSLIGGGALLRVLEALMVTSVAPLIDAALGGAALAGFIALLVWLTKGKGMGTGDIYVALALGIFFGLVRGVEVMTIAFWLGALFGVSAVTYRFLSTAIAPRGASKRLRGLTMKSEVPFVPFLFVATLVGLYIPISPLSVIEYLSQAFIS